MLYTFNIVDSEVRELRASIAMRLAKLRWQDGYATAVNSAMVLRLLDAKLQQFELEIAKLDITGYQPQDEEN